jgi:hypothetical protein
MQPLAFLDKAALGQCSASFSNSWYADGLHSTASGGLDIKCIVAEKQDLLESANTAQLNGHPERVMADVSLPCVVIIRGLR